MKHFTKLLTLLLALVTGQAAYAQLGVMTSTSDAEYEYYINRKVDKSHIYAESGGTTATDLYDYASTPDALERVKFIFKDADNDGYYEIYATNILVDENGEYIKAPITISSPTDQTTVFQLGLATATPAEFRLNPVSGNANEYLLQMNLITDSEGNEVSNSTTSTWMGANTTLKYRSNQKNKYFVWYVEAAAPAPITFSSYTKGALATYSTAIAATIPDGVKAYIAGSLTENDNVSTLALTEITGTIPAGVGVLLENTGLSDVAYPTEPENSASEMTSNFTPTTLAAANAPTYSSTDITESATGPITVAADGDDATTYVLGNPTGGRGLGFYPLSSEDRTIAAYKAYYNGPKQDTAGSSIKLQFPDGTTGILNIDGTGVKDAPVYDLMGRRVAKQTRGCLYISNGKKFIAQ